jgi:hypothetical protein
MFWLLNKWTTVGKLCIFPCCSRDVWKSLSGMENQKKRKFDDNSHDQEESSSRSNIVSTSSREISANEINTSQILQNLQKHLLNEK